jgi:hypothetical protein
VVDDAADGDFVEGEGEMRLFEGEAHQVLGSMFKGRIQGSPRRGK